MTHVTVIFSIKSFTQDGRYGRASYIILEAVVVNNLKDIQSKKTNQASQSAENNIQSFQNNQLARVHLNKQITHTLTPATHTKKDRQIYR